MAWLVEPTTGATFQLRDGAVIGSAPTADLAVDDAAIAAAHGRIERTTLGFALVAIEPAAFVVNGARATRTELVDGDDLRLGATRLIFKSTA